jgi:hypothetical protein
MLGRLGRIFSRMGVSGLKHGETTAPSGSAGTPMGLLLTLTYSA